MMVLTIGRKKEKNSAGIHFNRLKVYDFMINPEMPS
jgi:hypothetical protein